MIKSVYIKNFGKLNNLNLNFSEGYNLVYGENEAGKSTILAFIQMVFYGESKRTRDVLQNTRLKYKPWNGSGMAGHIDILKEGIEYRIRRIIKDTKKDDVLEVIQLDTGKELNFTISPGEYFFGINEETFRRTLFIASEDIRFSRSVKDDEISIKLLNLVSTGTEDTSFDRVILNLDTKIETFVSKNGKNGSIINQKSKIELLKLSIEDAKNDENEKLNFARKIEIIKEENEELRKALEKIEKKSEFELNKEKLNLEKEKLIETKEYYNNSKNIEQINYLLNQKNSFEKYKFDIIDGFLSIATLFLIVNLFLSIMPMSVKVFALVFSLVLLFFNFRNKIKENHNMKMKISNEIEKFENFIKDNNLRIDRINSDLKFINDAEIELYNDFSKQEIDIYEISKFDKDEIQSKISKNDIEISSILSTAKERYRGKENLSSLESSLKDEILQLEKLNLEYNNLLKVKELMVQSFEEFEINFAKVLNGKTSSFISKITNGKYNSIKVSNDFNLAVENSETKEIKEWKYLSLGTIDQIYLSLRLALAEIIIDSVEKRILLLDDIFIRCDENRIFEMKKWIENSNSFIQIIHFTCQNPEIYSNSNTNIIRLW